MTDQARASDRIAPWVWKMAAVVMLGPLMTSLDSTVVNVSLSRLALDFHSPLTTIQWVVSGYLLALALMLPLSGWLVDRVGAKRVYLGCFTAFTAASMLCGAATSPEALIGFRVLQGMCGGLLVPMAQMMTARGAGRHLARVMGFMVIPVLIGPIFGPSLAGAILQHGSWRWIFFINLPVGLAAILLAAWILPADAHTLKPRPFDLTGFLLLSPGLVLLLHSLKNLGSAPTPLHVLEGAAALVLLAAFVRRGLRLGPKAIVDVQLFRSPVFSAAARTQFLTNAVAFGGGMLLPLYLLTERNVSPSGAGLMLLPMGLGMLCSFPMMGPLTERFGSRRVSATGAFVALLGTLPFMMAGGLPGWAVGLALFVRGAGMGGISIPSMAAAYAGMPAADIPVATTAINIVQRLGGPAATTLLAIFLHARLGSVPLEAGGPRVAQAFAATFAVLCLTHAAVFLASLGLPLRLEFGTGGKPVPAEAAAK
jgi:EmrB/QacA subfamily drug resistance transporter